jgi:hypothetical protein
VADNDTQWTWNFTGPTTMSKAQSRPSTPREIAWELTGIDGNTPGCLRTHPAFKNITTFSASGTLVNFFPITLIYDASTYYVGYVVVREVAGTPDVTHFDFYLSSTGSSPTAFTSQHTVNASGLEVDIQCSGRYAYIYIRGYPAQVVYVASGTPTLTKLPAGPGLVPTVETQLDTGAASTISAPCGVASATITNAGSGYTSPPVLTFTAPTEPGRTAQGYAVISSGTVTSIVITDQGSGYDNASPPGITLTGGGYSSLATATAVVNPGVATASTTGRLAVMVDKRGNTGKTLYKSGNYGFAVQFLDSTTGRKSQISEIGYLEMPRNGNADQNLPIMLRVWFPSYYSGGAWVRGVGTTPGVYNKALIYRTVNQGIAGGSLYGNSPLHLDSIITAPADTSIVTPEGINVRVADTQLVYQDTFAGRTRSDNVPPQGGVAQFLGSTLFVSRVLGNTAATLTDSVTGVTPPNPPPGVGDLRWSTTLDTQPENFSQFSRWVPQTPGNEVIAMRRVGMAILGFSTDRMYKISRADSFIKVEEMHLGYGVAGKDTLEAIGTMTYLVSGAGLKAISADGQLEDVTSLDTLLNVDWASAKANLKMAFDATGQCLTILKPSVTGPDGEAACMWFGTNRITMLKDLPFKHMRSGNWIVSGKNVRRSLFVKRHDASGTYGVYIVDYERSLSGTNLCGGTARNVQFTTGSPPPLTPTADEFDCAGYKLDGTMTRTTVADMATAGSSATYANSNWSVAPILVRWTGGNIGFQMQPDQPEFKDFFRQKQVTNAAAYVELISGTYSPTFTQSWCAQVYEGTSDTPIYTATPVNQSGTKVSTVSYVGNEMPRASFGQHGVMGASLSPSFVFPVCGVEIKLLAFSLTGRILDTQRRRV